MWRKVGSTSIRQLATGDWSVKLQSNPQSRRSTRKKSWWSVPELIHHCFLNQGGSTTTKTTVSKSTRCTENCYIYVWNLWIDGTNSYPQKGSAACRTIDPAGTYWTGKRNSAIPAINLDNFLQKKYFKKEEGETTSLFRSPTFCAFGIDKLVSLSQKCVESIGFYLY